MADLFEKLVRGEITEERYELAKQFEKYKVGARIRVLEEHDAKAQPGMMGTIKSLSGRVAIERGSQSVGVEFDEEMGGHELAKHGEKHAKYGYGWWIPVVKLEVIDHE